MSSLLQPHYSPCRSWNDAVAEQRDLLHCLLLLQSPDHSPFLKFHPSVKRENWTDGWVICICKSELKRNSHGYSMEASVKCYKLKCFPPQAKIKSALEGIFLKGLWLTWLVTLNCDRWKEKAVVKQGGNSNRRVNLRMTVMINSYKP